MLRSIRPEVELPTKPQNFFSNSMISCSDTEEKKELNAGLLVSSLVHSHWSRNVEARLSLVERCWLLRQLSYAIKNQLVASKAPY